MKGTKERILQTAFSEFSKADDTTVSLAEIAKKSGVSKAAIFKHYKDKAALFEEMRARFFDEICGELREKALFSAKSKTLNADGGGVEISSYDLYFTIANFFAKKVAYFGILKMFCSVPQFMNGMAGAVCEEFAKRGFMLRQEAKGIEKISEYTYGFTTMFYLVIQYCRKPDLQKNIPSVVFAERTANFLVSGWNQIKPLSEAEKESLQSRCFVSSAEIPRVDRFFHALVAVTFKYGFTGITIERIADEVGIAKSSIYAFYQNKDALVYSVTKQEVGYLVQCLSEKLAGLSDVSQIVYVFLHVMRQYFFVRKEVVYIMFYFSRGGNKEDLYNDLTSEVNHVLSALSSKAIPVEGFEEQNYTLVEWLASLSASFLVQQYQHANSAVTGFSNEQADDAISRLYRQIGSPVGGMSGCCVRTP